MSAASSMPLVPAVTVRPRPTCGVFESLSAHSRTGGIYGKYSTFLVRFGLSCGLTSKETKLQHESHRLAFCGYEIPDRPPGDRELVSSCGQSVVSLPVLCCTWQINGNYISSLMTHILTGNRWLW